MLTYLVDEPGGTVNLHEHERRYYRRGKTRDDSNYGSRLIARVFPSTVNIDKRVIIQR